MDLHLDVQTESESYQTLKPDPDSSITFYLFFLQQGLGWNFISDRVFLTIVYLYKAYRLVEIMKIAVGISGVYNKSTSRVRVLIWETL